MMKVSFLVTYYNQAAYVKKSIDSILNIKKDFDWEILVGDDGSTDSTVEIVNEYIDKYPQNIRLYVMERGGNVVYQSTQRASANRLNLLSHITGGYYCVLDGDDWYCDSNFVNESLKIFKKYSDISIVMFGFKYVKKGVDRKRILPQKIGYLDKSDYISLYYIHAGACVFRAMGGGRRIEYLRCLTSFDDNDIVINNLNYGEVYFIPSIVYAYRQTTDSVFNSMGILERAVLNVQAYGVEANLLDAQYGDDLLCRYASAIIIMYFCRTRLRNVLGLEKYQMYCERNKIIQNSLCYDILIYDDMSYSRKKRILQIVIKSCRLFVKKCCKRFLNRMRFIVV